MEFEQIPTIKLDDDFDWSRFTEMYFTILSIGLSLHFGAVKLVLPDRMINGILPKDLASIRAKLNRSELGKITAKSV